MAIIEIFGIKAIVESDRWKCDDIELQKMLNTRYKRKHLLDYAPYPDLALANMAAKELDGKVIDKGDLDSFDRSKIY